MPVTRFALTCALIGLVARAGAAPSPAAGASGVCGDCRESAPPEAVEARPPWRPFFARLTTGGMYRRAIDEDFGGFDFEVQLGRGWPRFALAGLLGLTVGRTRFNLTFEMMRFGAALTFPLGQRWHLAAGPTLGALFIQRATDASTMLTGTAGLFVEPSVDVFQPRSGGALLVLVRLTGDFIGVDPSSSAWSVGAYAALGYRF
jgi:hypothetical protein